MIYFIRHAESQYNLVQAKIEEKHGPDYFNTKQYQQNKFNLDLIDVDITEKGQQQCLASREHMKDIDVDLIITSPLRRALQTCALTFEGHKSKAPVVVIPDFREVLCSSCDIGARITQSKKEFKDFDFSQLGDEDTWYINTIPDKKLRQRLLKEIEENKEGSKKQAAIEATNNFMKQWFEVRQKDPNNYDLVRRVLPSHIKQQQFLLEMLKTHKSIAVVSHSENMKSFIGYKINNCQVFPFTEEQLKSFKIE